MKTVSPAVAKLKMMKASIRCLVFGLLGLLPVIGLPFALVALLMAGRVRYAEKQFWNPASSYRRIGFICAMVGTFIWAGFLIIVIFQAVENLHG